MTVERVFDASVVLNLLGTGSPEQLLEALSFESLCTEQALREVTRDPRDGSNPELFLRSLDSRGLMQRVALSGDVLATFVDLVSAPSPNGLGDGEAATLAYAQHNGSIAVVDERKAVRIADQRGIPIESTVDLLRRPDVEAAFTTAESRQLLFGALRNARMRVPAEHFEWAHDTLGPELASQCPSLKRRR